MLLALAAGLGCGDSGEPFVPPPPAELGSLVVRWAFVDGAGDEVDCADLRITAVRVEVGQGPVDVACGDGTEARFTELLPGRFPVVLTPLALDGARRLDLEHVGNVVVTAGAPVEYTHAFELASTSFGEGRIEVRWFIDGQAPDRGCPLNGATDVRLELTQGPGADRLLDAACLDGRVALEDVRQGNYRLQLDLLDDQGLRIGFPAVEQSLLVTQNETTDVPLNVVTSLPGRGELLATWTVEGVAPPDGCSGLPEANEVEVAVRTDDGMATTVGTATAACAADGVFIDELPVGRTDGGAGLRVSFLLLDTTFGRTILDSQVVRDVVLQPSRTGTVSADFARPR